jgi:hypothetical protein
MRLRAPKARRISWSEYRRQMLDETSRFIEWGLKHPDLVIEIPAKRVGEGGFPKQVGEWFWGIVLTMDPGTRARRWRDVLLRRPKGLLRRLRS